MRVRFLGDAALCVDVDDVAPFEANARVHGLAAALRRAQISGVRDLVPGMTTLTVHVDPLRTDLAAIEAVVARAAERLVPAAGPSDSAVHQVRVRYGGDAGPDLDAVADAAGLTPAEVVQAHAGTIYRVCFLGFLPGFAYLGLVHDALRVPRRATPRSRVPAGSVAIADVFTGVYPSESPGGWHIIGHTDEAFFDTHRQPPARFAAGDAVRFVEN